MKLFSDIDPTRGEDTLNASIKTLADRLGTAPTPRSLCETGQDSEDYEWLRCWGQSLTPSTVCWWLNNTGFGNAPLGFNPRVSRFEGLGCLLLLLISEIGRREAREGHIWPVIRAVLQADTHKLLFDNVGQPLQPLKDAMEAAAERFMLRHVFGREGTLSYYVSVYLQFGFTHAAIIRLPYWLAGYGRTEAVNYLLDSDLGSTSFQQLWNSLLDFRRGNISRDQVRQTIAKSPWVLPEWTDELLQRSREKPDVSAAPRGDDLSPGWFEEPLLRWEPPDRPEFVTRIVNLGAHGLTSEYYNVELNGTPVGATLLRQPNGDYLGGDNITIGCATAQPLLSLVDADGTAHLSAELQLWNPQEEITVFVASTGRRIDAWSDCMSQHTAYAVLATCDLEVVPDPTAFYMVGNGKQRLSFLSTPWPDETRLLLDGDEFWTPILFNESGRPSSEPEWAQRIRVHIERHARLGQTIHPVVRGLADDVAVRYVRLNGHQLEFVRDHTIANLNMVTLSADLALRPLTFTLAVQRGDETVRIKRVPDPPIDIVGMVRRRNMEWEAVPEEQTLTVRDASAYPYKVLLPRASHNATRDLFIVEGSVFMRRLGSTAALLEGLEGLGAPLQIVHGYYNTSDILLTLAAQVIDPGVVQSIKYREGGVLFIHLNDTLEPGPGHCVVCWEPHCRPRIIPCTVITIRDNRTWQIEHTVQDLSKLMVGIAYDGLRIGASWPPTLQDFTFDAGKRLLPETLETVAALIRWMHAPILSRGYLTAMRSYARRYPAECMAAWLLDDGLPDGLRFRATNESWMSAVRQVFTGWRPPPGAARDIVETLSRDARTGWEEPLAAALPWLLRWNPLLLGHIVHVWLTSTQPDRRKPIGAQVRALQRQIAGLLPNDSDQAVGQRMIALRKQAAKAMGADENFVALGVAKKAIESLNGQELDSLDAANLEIALAVASFREYLGLRVLCTMAPSP